VSESELELEYEDLESESESLNALADTKSNISHYSKLFSILSLSENMRVWNLNLDLLVSQLTLSKDESESGSESEC
jgi:hypothetical protein